MENRLDRGGDSDLLENTAREGHSVHYDNYKPYGRDYKPNRSVVVRIVDAYRRTGLKVGICKTNSSNYD